MIELFKLAFLPEGPGVQTFEFLAGKAAKGVLGRGEVFRLEGVNQ